MSRRIILGAGLALILLVNYLPYGIEIVHGLGGAGFATLFIPLIPVLIGIPLVFRYSHRRIAGWVVLVGLLISILAFMFYYLRGGGFQTALILVLCWGGQGVVMLIGLLAAISTHKVGLNNRDEPRINF